jgi:tRNA dimethylallyltransferase
MKNEKYNLGVVLGATVSGKTHLAVELAKEFNAEIISADSRQVFRGMDIGTGKDLFEYGEVPYHLIDIVDPGMEYSVFEFQTDFYKAFSEIENRQKLPLLVGGTGMYLSSVLNEYRLIKVPENKAWRESVEAVDNNFLEAELKSLKPKLHNKTDVKDRERLIRALEIALGEKEAEKTPYEVPKINAKVIGIKWERAELRTRSTLRLQNRIAEGMVEEVEGLLKSGLSSTQLEFYGLEYRFICQMLKGEISTETMFAKLNQAIHKFIKRQETWFRKMEKEGVEICWVEGGSHALSQSQKILKEIG